MSIDSSKLDVALSSLGMSLETPCELDLKLNRRSGVFEHTQERVLKWPRKGVQPFVKASQGQELSCVALSERARIAAKTRLVFCLV